MKNFYQKTWFCVLMLICFFPIGLFLMWKYEKFNQTVRIIITGLFAVLFLSPVVDKETWILILGIALIIYVMQKIFIRVDKLKKNRK